MSRKGIVYIVGAGPGDPGMITVKGLAAIRTADVIMHDRLIDVRLLDEARLEAEIINVGKQPGRKDGAQELIHLLMTQKARHGKIVCRLKGGDPFVFGRGGEEAEALAEAGIPFEIVPGVTSAVAVPAYAGIPLTHRDHAHAFLVIAGCRSDGSDGDDWPVAARLVTGGGTLVILMGSSRLDRIMKRLIREGCPASMPAAVIQSGTSARQQTRVGTVQDTAQLVDGVRSPAVIVVGSTVGLRRQVRWYEAYALEVLASAED